MARLRLGKTHINPVLPANRQEHLMPRGDKSSYTEKQKRQANHIRQGYEDQGVSHEKAEARAWATVNKLSHGGKRSGSGRKHNVK